MNDAYVSFQLDTFFRRPEVPYNRLDDPNNGTMDVHVGTLYLLRQEMIRTVFNVDDLVSESSLRDRPLERRAFASAMLVFTGIDLLAKFLAGDDAQGEVGERFKTFCLKYMKLTDDGAEIVWAMRNAIMHSFGLNSVRGKPFFVQTGFADDVVTQPKGQWLLSISSLYWRFIDATNDYERDVRSKPELRRNFEKICPTYGLQAMAPYSPFS